MKNGDRKPYIEGGHTRRIRVALVRKSKVRKVGFVNIQAAGDAVAFDGPHPSALGLTETTGVGSLVRIIRNQLNPLDSEMFDVVVCKFEV